jgi:hypothetical protein
MALTEGKEEKAKVGGLVTMPELNRVYKFQTEIVHDGDHFHCSATPAMSGKSLHLRETFPSHPNPWM